MKNEKKFLVPEIEIISFKLEDIIVTSAGDGTGDMDNGEGEDAGLIP